MAQSEKIGALWKSDRREGMYSGELEINGEKIKIVAFVNEKKLKPNHPDINLLKARPRPVDSVQKPEEAAW